jgi:hypothetical protein
MNQHQAIEHLVGGVRKLGEREELGSEEAPKYLLLTN